MNIDTLTTAELVWLRMRVSLLRVTAPAVHMQHAILRKLGAGLEARCLCRWERPEWDERVDVDRDTGVCRLCGREVKP